MFLFLSGINIFLDGFVPTENLRFREASLTFKVSLSQVGVLCFLSFTITGAWFLPQPAL